jgi:class 3 adenylate cyclase
VSVLFADLVSFTTLAEGRDPEAVRDLLGRYFDVASEVVERYGGKIEKFIGDAVMAVWGTPIAREDDAERAVRAALDLLDAVRTLGDEADVALAARAGVLTGEAAVNLGARNQGMVAGDLVNTAARLQSVAPEATVLVGEATRAAASGAVVFEEAGAHVLKGKTAPVPAWRAVRVVAGVGGRERSDILEPPFVGRETEYRLLRQLFHATGRDRKARLVSLTGQAGIGKSRLAWEFRKYTDGVVETVWWHQGRCPAYGEGVAFWALGEMVRRRAGLAEGDDEVTTRDRIGAALDQWVPDPAERAFVEPCLLALLGVADPPAGGRERLFAGWRTFLERIADHGTVALVFEDLHWADDGLLDFIEHLLEWSRSFPIYVVTLARPELLDRRPTWGAARNANALALGPLSGEEMRELLLGMVPGLPEAAVRTILERADGIPLYAVETIRTLVADDRLVEQDGHCVPTGDLGTLEVPATLQALIAARLDALEPAARTLVGARPCWARRSRSRPSPRSRASSPTSSTGASATSCGARSSSSTRTRGRRSAASTGSSRP